MAESSNSSVNPQNPDLADTGANLSTTPKNDGNSAGNFGNALREDLVNTAVKFLQSPKVRETPLGHRKAFLVKKGLTDAEIQEAISRSGALADETYAAPVSYQQHGAVAPPPPRPLPASWRDYAQAMMFVSGAGYVAYKFVRGYVLPTWFNVPDPERERLRRLDENMNDVQNGLKFLVDSVQQTLGVVQQQQETLNRLVNQLIEKDKTTAAQERAIQDLRTEVATIKSLLLSRDQFPPLPTASSATSIPTIPAWQLSASNTSRPQLTNGTIKNGPSINDRRFILGADGEDDDFGNGDGFGATEEPFLSATGSENGEKMTPV